MPSGAREGDRGLGGSLRGTAEPFRSAEEPRSLRVEAVDALARPPADGGMNGFTRGGCRAVCRRCVAGGEGFAIRACLPLWSRPEEAG
jgi:hypothetical protein